MADFFTKLRILCGLLISMWEHWRDDIWPHDLDARYCCDGRECGCCGQTRRDVYAPSSSKGERNE